MGPCTPLYAWRSDNNRILRERPRTDVIPDDRGRIANNWMCRIPWTVHRLGCPDEALEGRAKVFIAATRSHGRQEFARTYRHSTAPWNSVRGTGGIPYMPSNRYPTETGQSHQTHRHRHCRSGSTDNNLACILLALIRRRRPLRLSHSNFLL